ncbi:MAG: PAS domain S-box protein, partial [Desulfotomaculaceae bacterium]|nr:PAS domain S-box protein [Desulfotomaculaceae bacterium]
MKDDKDGNNASFKGSTGDVARRDLEASEARYRAIVEDQTEMICRFLPGGELTLVNEAYCRCFGKKREELIGKSFMTLIPEDDHDLFYKHLASLSMENPVSVVEHRVILPGGEVRWHQWTDRAIFDGYGRLVEFQSVGRDVTKRKRAEEELMKYRQRLEEMVQERTNALRAANEQLHSEIAERRRAEESLRRAYGQLTDIVEFLPDATFVIDLDKKVISWNRAIEEMTGVRKEDILGRGDYAYSVPFYGDPGPILIDLVISGDSEIETKYGYIERKACKIFGEIYTPGVYQGRGAFLWGTASPLFDGAGNKVGAIESIRDITELYKAREEAEAASRAKGEFLMNMSHEIRTPMNAITGMAELLLNSSLSEEQRDYAATIYESGRLLLAIIDDILDFSKIEAKNLSLEEVDFEPAPLIEGVTKLMAVKAIEKNLLLRTFIDSGVPPLLRGDTVRLRQVLFNLVGNAVKFTERGGVALRAGVVSKGKEHVVLRFEVSDTGIGIPREDCGRIFRAFSQVNGTIARRFGGTGLGLAISSQLVKLMGGEIGVESEKGKGSTFWFTVPFKYSKGNNYFGSIEAAPTLVLRYDSVPAVKKEGLI